MSSEYRELLESLDPYILVPAPEATNLDFGAVDTGLGYLPFNAGNGPRLYFNDNTGSFTSSYPEVFGGAPSPVPGEYSYLMSGRRGLRATGLTGLEDLSGGFSCVAIVRPTAVGNYNRIICFGRSFINSEIIFSRLATSNDLSFGWWNGTVSSGTPVVTSSSPLKLNRFIHVVGVYDPIDSKAKLYVDGVQHAEVAVAGPPAYEAQRSIIAFGMACTNTEYFTGSICMPAVFRRTLTPAEIMDMARKSTVRPITRSGRTLATPIGNGPIRVVGSASVGGGKVFETTADEDGYWTAQHQDIEVNIAYSGVAGRGDGYLAGTFPDGITTVAGVPQQAEVRALLRTDSELLEDARLCGVTESAPDGTWRISGLDVNAKYDVVARKDGHNDVIVSAVQPLHELPVAIEAVSYSATNDALEGEISLFQGIGPFTVDAYTGFPGGIAPVMDGDDTIIFFGSTADVGLFPASIDIKDSDGTVITKEYLLSFNDALPTPTVSAEYRKDGERTVTLTIEGTVSFAEVRVYRDTATMSPGDLPAPVAVLKGGVTKWVDTTVPTGQTVYYRIEQAAGAEVALSSEVSVLAKWLLTEWPFQHKALFDWDSTVTLTSGAVSQWDDQSGNGVHAAQATTARRPTPVASAIGTKPAIRFNGSQCFTLTSVGGVALRMMSAVRYGWAFAIFRKLTLDSAGADRPVIWIPRSGAGTSRFAFSYSGSGAKNRLLVGGRHADAGAFYGATAPYEIDHTGWIMMFGICDYVDNTIRLFHDGQMVAKTTGAWGVDGTTPNNNSYTVPYIGATSGLTSYLDMDLAMLMVGSGPHAPTEGDISRLFGWAAWECGLQDNLPVDHPYKDGPP